jgi:hypothetical protein
VPILIVADVIIDPLIASNLESIGLSGLIEEKQKSKYKAAVEQLKRRKDSHLVDIVIIFIIVAMSMSFILNLEDLDTVDAFAKWSMILKNNEPQLTYAGWWFCNCR